MMTRGRGFLAQYFGSERLLGGRYEESSCSCSSLGNTWNGSDDGQTWTVGGLRARWQSSRNMDRYCDCEHAAWRATDMDFGSVPSAHLPRHLLPIQVSCLNPDARDL
jgi:hypothetical protein